MFSKLGIDTCHVPLALKGLEKDSQKGVLGKPGHKNVNISKATWDSVTQLWKEFGIPCRADMTAEEYKEVVRLDK